MKTPLISTREDAANLRALALRWIGTPWTADGAVRGTGASCTTLPYAILSEAGHRAPTPPARQNVLKRAIISTIELWMQVNSEHYEPVALDAIQPGDIIMFNCGIGHCGLALGGTEMLHTWQTSGAHISNFNERTLASRMLRAWRPVVSTV